MLSARQNIEKTTSALGLARWARLAQAYSTSRAEWLSEQARLAMNTKATKKFLSV